MSQRFSLDKQEDLKKILIGAGVAITGALLTYISETIIQIDFGGYTAMVVAMWSIIANIIRKYIVQS